GEDGSVTFSMRRSYADLFVPHLVDIEQIVAFPRFWDYQGSVEYDLSPTQHLQIDAIVAQDNMALHLSEEDEDDPELVGNLNFDSGFAVQGATLRSTFGGRVTLRSSLSRFHNMTDLSLGQGYFLRIEPTQYGLREDLTWKAHPRHTLMAGLMVNHGTMAVDSYFANIFGEEPAPDEDFSDIDKTRVNETKTALYAYAYAQDRIALRDNLDVTLGGRVGYLDLTEPMFDPRANIAWRLGGGQTVRASWGLYHQTPQPFSLFEGWGNPKVGNTSSAHYTFEIERQVDKTLSVQLAGYYKRLWDLVTDDEVEVVKNQGTGNVRGFEVMARYRPSERFFGLLSYANSESRRRYRPEDPEILYNYDQTHVATVAATVKPTRKWDIGLKWQYGTGMPYTPVVGSTFNATKGDYTPIYGATNSERFPAFHRLDLRVGRTWQPSGWQMQTYLEILNLYNRANVVDVTYNDDYSEREWVHNLPMIPFIGVEARF
ncbi:MAG: TonB-dependent receptor, partial [Candidatus Poribacteria bacterium]|nr:TonB-dependent receptor [Candidatus Poribacteria bacterium]